MICNHCSKNINNEEDFIKDNNLYLNNFYYHKICKEEIELNNKISFEILKNILK
jgi:hypothetical protein